MEQIVSVIAGLIGVPVFNWIKWRFNLGGELAALLAGVLSAILAVGVLFATGGLKPESFTVGKLIASFGLIYSVATLFYKVIIPRGIFPPEVRAFLAKQK